MLAAVFNFMVALIHPPEPASPASQFLDMLEMISDGGMDNEQQDEREFLAEVFEDAAQRLRNPSRKEGAA